jgi:hypothetical protein
MSLYREGKSVARLVVVKQEEEVVDFKNGLFPHRDVKLEVRY